MCICNFFWLEKCSYFWQHILIFVPFAFRLFSSLWDKKSERPTSGFVQVGLDEQAINYVQFPALVQAWRITPGWWINNELFIINSASVTGRRTQNPQPAQSLFRTMQFYPATPHICFHNGLTVQNFSLLFYTFVNFINAIKNPKRACN